MQHAQPVFQGESVALFGIRADGDDQTVKQPGSLFNHPYMTYGKRVKAPRVHPETCLCAHLQKLAKILALVIE